MYTFTAHGSRCASPRADIYPRESDLSILMLLYHYHYTIYKRVLLICECHTYICGVYISGRKMAQARPSPAANPLIYRLRVSLCIRRLGHIPRLAPLSLSFPPQFFLLQPSTSQLAYIHGEVLLKRLAHSAISFVSRNFERAILLH